MKGETLTTPPGGDALAELTRQLRDIHQPEPHFWWPPAPGWWLLAGLALGLLAFGLWRRRRRRALRRAALAELRRIQTSGASPRRQAAEVEMLLRRVALARRPRAQVAPLQGEEWLRCLDRLGDTQAFSRGPGRALLRAPWDPKAPADLEALLALARLWLEKVA